MTKCDSDKHYTALHEPLSKNMHPNYPLVSQNMLIRIHYVVFRWHIINMKCLWLHMYFLKDIHVKW